MTSLLDQMDVYVLPVFNIDGYVYTHTSVCYGLLKHKFLVLQKHCYVCSVDLQRAFHSLGNFRTGCGGRLVPQDLDQVALEPTPTGTLTLDGAVSRA